MTPGLTLDIKRKLGLRSRRPLPHFLVLGTQKGGTTSLHQLLATHPQVYLPACKEVQYFSLYDQETLGWYAKHYANSQAGQLRGDITPYYLFHPRAPQRIHSVLPRAKMIVLLRNPVERALSQYFHARRHGFEQLELEAAIEAETRRLEGADERLSSPGSFDYSHQKHSYVSRSRYEEQLDRYYTLFPQEQLLLLRSEDLFNNTEMCWKRIQFFLGLKSVRLTVPIGHANAGQSEAKDISRDVRKILEKKLATTTAAMAERYGIMWDERRVNSNDINR